MEVDQNQLVNLLGQGGFSAALLFLIWKVGQRFIIALDRLTAAITAHHQTDTAHHGEVAGDIAEIKGALGLGIAPTPTPIPRTRLTPPIGTPLLAPDGKP